MFWCEVSKSAKTSTQVHSFYTSVSLKKPHSLYELQLSQHYKIYTLATQSKTSLTLQIFKNYKVSGLCHKKHLYRTFFGYRRTAFSKQFESKCLYIPHSRHKDVAKTSWKRLNFGLKDVLHWSEMEVTTSFFEEVFKTSLRDVLKTSLRSLKMSSRLFMVKATDQLETIYGLSMYVSFTTALLSKDNLIFNEISG